MATNEDLHRSAETFRRALVTISADQGVRPCDHCGGVVLAYDPLTMGERCVDCGQETIETDFTIIPQTDEQKQAIFDEADAAEAAHNQGAVPGTESDSLPGGQDRQGEKGASDEEVGDKTPSKELWQMTRDEVGESASAKHPSPSRTQQHETLKAISDRGNKGGYDPAALTPDRLAPLREAKLISRSEANPKLTDEGRSLLMQSERDFKERDLDSASASDQAIDAALDAHRSAVENAVASGKSVPVEVLEEYGIALPQTRSYKQGKLIATGSSLDAVQKQIAKYYYGSTITLNEQPDGSYSVSNKKGTIEGVEVIPHKGGFRFQEKAPIGKSEAAARKAAAILERAKLKGDRLYALPIPPSVWNGAIGALQDVLVAGGKAVDAIAAAIKHIQDSDWWKNKATQKEKDEVMGHLQGRISDLEAAIAHEDVASLKDNIKKARAAAVKGERCVDCGQETIETDFTIIPQTDEQTTDDPRTEVPPRVLHGHQARLEALGAPQERPGLSARRLPEADHVEPRVE